MSGSRLLQIHLSSGLIDSNEREQMVLTMSEEEGCQNR